MSGHGSGASPARGRQPVFTPVFIMLHQPTPEPITSMRETALYVPVKRFLEGLGFDVKGEICGCDLVALRADEPPLVVIG